MKFSKSEKSNLFRILSKELNKHQSVIAKQTINQAESDGLEVIFVGTYQQGISANAKLQASVPFVIAQNTKQMQYLGKEGILLARVYDARRFANIRGEITPKKVKFIKVYSLDSITEEDKISLDEIREMFEPERKGKPYINPHDILYEGNSEDGITYSGNWRFACEDADIATNGTFSMQRRSD